MRCVPACRAGAAACGGGADGGEESGGQPERQQGRGRQHQAVELQKELWENESRVGSLERTAAQKELQLLGFHEEKSALKSERDGLQREFQSLRDQHSISMRETQEQALRQMQRELKKLKEELALTHEEHIQQAHRQAEEKKTVAFREQAISHTQHIESTQSCIQIHSTIEQERKKWKIEKEKALQVQCGILEEQGRDALERVRGRQSEKKNALALQNKALELQTGSRTKITGHQQTIRLNLITMNERKWVKNRYSMSFLSPSHVRECRSWRVSAVCSRGKRCLLWLQCVGP
ncbi:trichohyalin-like [Coregonus clupeaformis]|uniref:trichohyalin-like n=1 Tax=Coregonus clupeaformis TaxID=59861 RepID=UPI001E1C7D59|nr:trichohyalin-like [Coregonus clupeaformis]